MMKSFLMKFFLKIASFQEKAIAENNKRDFLAALKKNPNSIISDHIKLGKHTTHLIAKESSIFFGTHLDIRNNCNFVVGKNAELVIEDHVFMNNNCSVNCLEKIVIGENTLFGEGVKIYDHNHQYSAEKVEHQKFNTAPIVIGKNCWLGSNVIVLKGVTIGNNSIIGAGCIVHKDITANSVVTNKQEQIIKSL